MAADSEVTPGRLRAPRAAAVAGILFAGLFGVAVALVRQAVPASPDDAGAWLTDPSARGSARFGLNLVPFAGISFLWFMGALRDRIGAREDKFFATLFLGTGFLFVGMLFVLAAFAGGLLSLAADHDGRPPLEVWQYGRPAAYNLVTLSAMRLAGAFAIATSAIGLRLGLFPRWLALVGLVVGALSLLAVGVVPWLELAFPLWVLAVSIRELAASFRRPRG